jgi:hypothetical protein
MSKFEQVPNNDEERDGERLAEVSVNDSTLIEEIRRRASNPNQEKTQSMQVGSAEQVSNLKDEIMKMGDTATESSSALEIYGNDSALDQLTDKMFKPEITQEEISTLVIKIEDEAKIRELETHELINILDKRHRSRKK